MIHAGIHGEQDGRPLRRHHRVEGLQRSVGLAVAVRAGKDDGMAMRVDLADRIGHALETGVAADGGEFADHQGRFRRRHRSPQEQAGKK